MDGWDENWGEDWNEETNELEEVVTEDTDVDEELSNNACQKWLQDCVYSISPAADLIALANQNRMVLMSRMYLFSTLILADSDGKNILETLNRFSLCH